MTDHDLPSKYETKQTSSLSIKTCIPLPAPTVLKMEPLGILSVQTQLLGTDHSEERGRSFCDWQRHPVAATKNRKSQVPSSWSLRNPQVLKKSFWKTHPFIPPKKEHMRLKSPFFRKATCQASLRQAPAESQHANEWLFFFVFLWWQQTRNINLTILMALKCTNQWQ